MVRRGLQNGRAAGVGSQAVSWRVGDSPIASGSLALEGDDVVLRGSTPDGVAAVERLPLDRIDAVRIGRSGAERLSGRRSIVLDSGERTVAVAPVGDSAIFELSELLAELSAEAATRPRRLVVVLPLRAGSADRARELLADGPPFDLDRGGLEEHQVFVTDREAIFVFEGRNAREAVERLARNPRVVREAARWRECIAGRPRIADETFSWRRGRG